MSIYVNDPLSQKAQACMIWMHGLGANADDMAGLAQELSLEVPMRHVFLDAPVRPITLNQGMPMQAWYDLVGLNLGDREDKAGILESESLIRDVLADQMGEGFPSERIFLAGFSQGGAMALYAGLSTPSPLAGVIALSAYLPLATECEVRLDRRTPIFLGLGRQDTIVWPTWTQKTRSWLQEQEFKDVACHEYIMAHSVCREELNDLSVWIAKQVLKGGAV